MKTDIRSEKGFTLVELAVVMIIIGLLIGGVLKGQELIKSAKVTSTISQIKGIDAAVSTFQDIYAGLPGDLPSAGARLPGCTGVCAPTAAAAGTLGDGIVTSATAPFTPGVATTDDETVGFFPQLAAADLISGVAPGTNAFGGNFPQAPVGGGLVPSSITVTTDLPTAQLVADVTDFRSGLYLMHQQAFNSTTLQASNSLTMQRIDRKIDDGNPLSGSVYAAEQGAGECVAIDASSAAVNLYNTAESQLFCNAIIRIQN